MRLYGCKKIFRELCLLVLLSVLPGLSQGGDFKVVVFKVDSADSSLIVFPTGKTMLIDTAGRTRTVDTVMTFLQRHGITHLDYLMKTHEHPDHVAGVPDLQAGGFVDSATVVWDWNTFKYKDTFTLEGTDWFIYNARDTAFNGTDANYNSLSYRIEYNGFVYSGTGDEGTKSMTRFMNDFPALVPAHVRNTEHHGYGPSSEAFLNMLNAKMYIVSCATECESYSGYKLIKKVAAAKGAVFAHTHYTSNIYIRASSSTNWSYKYYAKAATIPGFYTQPTNSTTCHIDVPAGNVTKNAGDTLLVKVSAFDSDGIERVKLFKGTTELMSDSVAPYEFTVTNLTAGSFVLIAKVKDVLGNYTTSDNSITVTVTSGTTTTTVPNVINLTQAAATTSITGAGLVVGTVSTAHSSTVAAGKVISQTPGGGTTVNLGSSVALSVSLGPVTSGTTVTFTSVAAHDGYVDESSETSNVGGAMSAALSTGTALRVGDTGARKQRKGFVSFDTSSLPDNAVVTAATLKLKRGGIVGTPISLGALTADIKGVNAGFGTRVALEAVDFQAAASKSNIGTFNYPAANNAWATASLDTNGTARVNRTGHTQFRIHFATDDDNDSADDYLGFCSGENATATNRPILEVTYQ